MSGLDQGFLVEFPYLVDVFVGTLDDFGNETWVAFMSDAPAMVGGTQATPGDPNSHERMDNPVALTYDVTLDFSPEKGRDAVPVRAKVVRKDTSLEGYVTSGRYYRDEYGLPLYQVVQVTTTEKG